MKKKYYGILLAAVIAAGTIGVTAQAAELADTEKLTETANVTDDVNTANSTDAFAQMLLYRHRVMNWKCHWY